MWSVPAKMWASSGADVAQSVLQFQPQRAKQSASAPRCRDSVIIESEEVGLRMRATIEKQVRPPAHRAPRTARCAWLRTCSLSRARLAEPIEDRLAGSGPVLKAWPASSVAVRARGPFRRHDMARAVHRRG